MCLEWNVFYYDINSKKIRVANILDHNGLCKDIEKALHKCKNRDDFAENVRLSLMYYFWSRSEWETVIHPWIGDDNAAIKVDIYWQVRMNWDRFIDYLWYIPQGHDLRCEDMSKNINDGRHGHWVYLSECANEGVYCSVCHKKVYKSGYANQKIKSKYCPNCGAIMDEDFEGL